MGFLKRLKERKFQEKLAQQYNELREQEQKRPELSEALLQRELFDEVRKFLNEP